MGACSAKENITYDNRSAGGYGYTYNAANRMASFALNGVVQAEYVYNAFGQQVIRRLPQTGAVIHAVHDADGNRIAEYAYDTLAGTSALLREYIWMDGEAVAVVENDTVYYIRSDHIGRPVFATDGAGVQVWTANYLPFGGVYASSGLHQNWMRDYDPTLGRYIQGDPLGLIDGASVYGYARQSPGVYSDFTGECPWCAAFAVNTAFFAAGVALDYFLDDCYTWQDFGVSAASNINPFKKATTAFKAVNKGMKKKLRGTKHTDNRHVDRTKYPHKTKYKKPAQRGKLEKKQRTILIGL